MRPKNNLYFNSEDNVEWHDYFTSIYPAYYQDRQTNNHSLVCHVTFVVTEKCNLRCTYCYESHASHAKGERMSQAIAKKSVDLLFDQHKLNDYFSSTKTPGIVLEFIGGEPLLEIGLIDYICDYFRIKAFGLNSPWAYNYMISIPTNGTLYFSEKVQRFLEKNKGKVSLGITIDGNKTLHDRCRVTPDGQGTYDLVEKAVKYHTSHYGLETTKLTIAPENVMYLYDALKHCWEVLNLPYVYANCVFEDVWTQKDALIFKEQLIKIADYLLEEERYSKYGSSLFSSHLGSATCSNENFCGGNGSMLAIGPDGRCYPCIRFMPYALQNDREAFSCGDVINGLWNKEDHPKLKKLCDITIISQSNETCQNCSISEGCGSCIAYNYDLNGDPNQRATCICDTHHARTEANDYYFDNLFKLLKIDPASK